MRTSRVARAGAVLAATCGALTLAAGPVAANAEVSLGAAGAAARASALPAFGSPALPAAGASALPAAQPMDVTTQITDPGGVLGAREDEVRSALDRLTDATPYRLFVVFVDTFDAMDGVDWANQTATASALEADDVLLAVATRERAYGLSVDPDVALTDPQLLRIEAAAEEHFTGNDWAGAAIAVADTTRQLVTGVTAVPAKAPGPGSVAAGRVVGLLTALGAGALAIWLAVRRRHV